MNKYDVVALGELLIDFTCVSQDENGYPTVAAHPGGAPANFLAAVNNFGGKTAMIGKVGEDTFGHLLISTLEQSVSMQQVLFFQKTFSPPWRLLLWTITVIVSLLFLESLEQIHS